MTDPHQLEAWNSERFERLAEGIRLYSLIAIVIFTVFWGLDLLVFPLEIAWRFLFLRLICSAGYVVPLLLVRRASKLWFVKALGLFAVWWVSAGSPSSFWPAKRGLIASGTRVT